jgi:hypothetical protein
MRRSTMGRKIMVHKSVEALVPWKVCTNNPCNACWKAKTKESVISFSHRLDMKISQYGTCNARHDVTQSRLCVTELSGGMCGPQIPPWVKYSGRLGFRRGKTVEECLHGNRVLGKGGLWPEIRSCASLVESEAVSGITVDRHKSWIHRTLSSLDDLLDLRNSVPVLLRNIIDGKYITDDAWDPRESEMGTRILRIR